jgi:hypothetical protein
MFGKTTQAKSPGAAIAFLSGKKYKPTDKVMADDGDMSDEGHPGLGVSSSTAPARQDGPLDAATQDADGSDLKTQIDALIDQYGAQAVQDQMDQCMQEGGTETDEDVPADTDSGTDLSAVDPTEG